MHPAVKVAMFAAIIGAVAAFVHFMPEETPTSVFLKPRPRPQTSQPAAKPPAKGPAGATRIKERAGQLPVISVEDDDAAMNAAMQKARSTIDTFITALRNPKPSQTFFSLKTPFSDGDKCEHMWLIGVTYDGQKFHGVVNNVPDEVRTVRLGQKVTIAPSEVSDWMIIQDGKLVGGYTVRVLRDREPPGKREEFDRHVGFTID